MTLEINTDDFWKELDQRVIDARTERKLFIEEITELRAKVAELEAKLAKYENLEPVAYMCEEDPERESAFAWTHGICPGCGNYRIPLYALEK